MQTFPIDEVLAVSCAVHRLNGDFIKKDQVRFDKKYENKTCNSDMLYNYFFTDKKFDVIILAVKHKEFKSLTPVNK